MRYFGFIIFLVISLGFIPGCQSRSPQVADSPPQPFDLTIAFGSCNHQWEPQDVWPVILSHNPVLWIWLGDIIYADTEDMGRMKGEYNKLKDNAAYRGLLKSCPVVGIWDDHDFGANNAGKGYPMKDSSKTNLLQFLDVPADSSVWNRQGAYQAYNFDKGGYRFKLLLLDARYFRDDPGVPQGTVLGEEQWTWLTHELSASEADIHLFGSGIQVLPEEHQYEKWFNYPGEKERLLALIDSFEVRNALILSGDRHFGEIMVQPTPEGRQVIEVTSSGLTHSYETLQDEPNRFRVGPFTNHKNFGLLLINNRTDSLFVELRGTDNALAAKYGMPLAD